MRGFAEFYLRLVELDFDAFIRAGPLRDELWQGFSDPRPIPAQMQEELTIQRACDYITRDINVSPFREVNYPESNERLRISLALKKTLEHLPASALMPVGWLMGGLLDEEAISRLRKKAVFPG